MTFSKWNKKTTAQRFNPRQQSPPPTTSTSSLLCVPEWKAEKYFSAPFVPSINYCFQCCGDAGNFSLFEQLNKSTVNWLLMCQHPLTQHAHCFYIFLFQPSPAIPSTAIIIPSRLTHLFTIQSITSGIRSEIKSIKDLCCWCFCCT